MGIRAMKRNPMGQVLIGILFSVGLVCLPVDTMSTQDASTENAVLERTELFPLVDSLVEVGEASAPPEGIEPALINGAIHDLMEKPQTDRRAKDVSSAIHKLMNDPVVDPRQRKAYQKAGAIVHAIQGKLEGALKTVVEEQLFVATHVTSKDVAKAESVAKEAHDLAHAAGEAVMEAAKSHGVGCQDTHPGLCAGIQVQGHCGIKQYATACPLACHVCTAPLKFDNDDQQKEEALKQAEEKGGKAAIAKVRENAEKTRIKMKAAVNKQIMKVKIAKAKVDTAQETVERARILEEGMRSASEREEKAAAKMVLKAKAKAKLAKEKMEKDKKKKPVEKKPDDSAVKGEKSKEKEEEDELKKEGDRLKKNEKTQKEEEKKVKKLKKSRAAVGGQLDKVIKQREELEVKKKEAGEAKKLAEKLSGKEGEKMKKTIQKSTRDKAVYDNKIKYKRMKLQDKINQQTEQEGILNAKREKKEIVSKEERKQLQQLTAPGEEKRVKVSLMTADKDIKDLHAKFKRKASEYAHLGLQWTVPAEMNHQEAKAEKSKEIAEKYLTKLDKENNSPAAQELRKNELYAKEMVSMEDARFRALKKASDFEKKEVKKLEEDEKKRVETMKKEIGVSQKTAEKVLKDAADKEKKDQKAVKKEEENIKKTQDAAAKDTVTDEQITSAEASLDKSNLQVKREKRAIARKEKKIRKAKGKIVKAEEALAKEKTAAKAAAEQAKEANAVKMAKDKAVVENAKAVEKIASDKVKEEGMRSASEREEKAAAKMVLKAKAKAKLAKEKMEKDKKKKPVEKKPDDSAVK